MIEVVFRQRNVIYADVMRQIIYESVATDRSAEDIAPDILRFARPENGLNGVTGLLLFANGRFLQVLEGPEESVSLTMDRIRADPRHRDIAILADRPIEKRAFADWGMAYRDEGHPADLLDDRLRLMVSGAPPEIGDHFRRFLHA
ncbi:BLUF domain-containing protein [uncultured Sphingomonas sp.]|uniref:BLUF domain-containing protein n=1 Tax=uncultured Sphingomonas sp. TaxID=158754 RepID=UPI0035CC65E1